MRDAGFLSVPVHVAILDKGQRSVKGLNSGSEGVVTVDLVVTLQKPANASRSKQDSKLVQADARSFIERALASIPETMRSPSHVYAAIVRDAIKQHQMVDHLHLSDVLIALRNAGYTVDPKKGLLIRAIEDIAVAAA
jgi:hypothetical protein